MAIWVLEDGQEQGKECLGEIRLLRDLPCRTLRLRKRLTVNGLGHYRKELEVPVYPHAAVVTLRRGQPKEERLPLLGAVGPQPRPDQVLGYALRRKEAHRFCLAVSPQEAYQGIGWRTLGYLSTEKGWVAVMGRRVLFWVVLALAALGVFGLSYLGFHYGWERGFAMLGDALLDLPRTLEGWWFGLWHGAD